MKWILDSLKEYFNFTRCERDGVIALLFLILLVLIAPRFIHRTVELPEGIIDAFHEEVEAFNLHNDSAQSFSKNLELAYRTEKITFFSFDPNLATNEEWARLGLTDRQVQTIRNYQSKGGVFKEPKDLLKLYGIPLELKEELAAHAKISKPSISLNHVVSEQKSNDIFLDLNTADSLQLLQLPGIGPVLSRRILAFRSSLGGFHSVEQVREVYGLSPDVFSQIKGLLIVNDEGIKKLDINRCSDWQLARHPYISTHHARAIMRFRDFQGGFKTVEEIREFNLLPDSIFFRIAPYLFLPEHSPAGTMDFLE
jgi:competence protein ComEA